MGIIGVMDVARLTDRHELIHGSLTSPWQIGPSLYFLKGGQQIAMVIRGLEYLPDGAWGRRVGQMLTPKSEV